MLCEVNARTRNIESSVHLHLIFTRTENNNSNENKAIA